MYRRQFHFATAGAMASVLLTMPLRAQALSLADLSNADATKGLKAALEMGASTAVSLLGKPDGFLGNPTVRIGLPGSLEDAAKFMRMLGQGRRIDALVDAMNHAAEAAVPLARDMLVAAVRSMTVTDARAILTGGETSVTEFFAGKTRAPLRVKFLPVVTKVVARSDLADQYNQIAGKASAMGLVRPEDASVQGYVTGKALDGLYLMIGDEERKFRQNPLAAGNAAISKVFGALK